MGSDEQTVYILKDSADSGADADNWISPEPADEVITEHILEATDLSSDDVDDIESYVDFEELRAVVGEGDESELSFTVEGHTVTVSADGSIVVDTA